MQHPIRTALFGGVAALAVAGLAGVAQAQTPAEHVVTLALPGGGQVQVAYAGSTPPHLVGFTPAPFATMRTAFGPGSPFAAINAAMNRMANQMWQQAETLARMPIPDFATPGGGLTLAALPAGPGVCVQSVSVTYDGTGAAPKVVRRQAGDCGTAAAPAATTTPYYLPAQPARPAGGILVRSTTPRPQPRLVEAAYWHPVNAPPSR